MPGCHITGLVQEVSCGAGVVVVVIVVIGVERLYRDARVWLGGGVVGLRAWVVLGAQLHC